MLLKPSINAYRVHQYRYHHFVQDRYNVCHVLILIGGNILAIATPYNCEQYSVVDKRT